MTTRVSASITVTNGSDLMYQVKQFFKTSGGWTVPRSSDGITMSLVADVITHAGAGAGGLANLKAWFVLRDPSGRREYCFQRTASNNTDWRITFSELSRFIIGSPSATVVPSAADTATLHGAGTDGVPVNTTFLRTDGSYKLQVCVDPTPIGIGDVYLAWFGTSDNVTPSDCGTMFMAEALKEYDEGDTSPIIHFVRYTATAGFMFVYTAFGSASVQNSMFTGWFKYGLGGSSYVALNANGYGAQNSGYPVYSGLGNIPAWPISGKLGGISLFLFCIGVAPKGVVMHMKHPFSPKAFPNTLNIAGDEPYIYWNGQTGGGGCSMLMPWSNTVPTP